MTAATRPPLDLLVVGSGVAGLSAAVRAARDHHLRVGVLTKGDLNDGSTRWAQGGVAAVLHPGEEDSTELHLADTLAAGGDLCDEDAVRVLVEEGPRRVRELIDLGAVFDRGADGELLTAREGGHSLARIVHAGGSATGAEVERALDEATRVSDVELFERWFAHELLVEGGRCVGVRALRPDGGVSDVRATHVLLATGGAGQLFAVTTNPTESTGDGSALALAAGVVVADLEFMQFHPTALHTPRMPRPLLTEALRGHGALLRGPDGERFVDELLPRDVVSRAETAVMVEHGIDHVWLDATGLDRFAERFPNIAADLAAVGLDPTRDWLPVAPAAHYLSGGLVTDLHGATTLPGLWAAGETACTGVHGANRLASNSLLEGLVYGPRVVEAIAAGIDRAEATGAMRTVLGSAEPHIAGRRLAHDAPIARPDVPETVEGPRPAGSPVTAALRVELQRGLTFDAGVLRSETTLKAAQDLVEDVADRIGDDPSVAAWELANLCTVGAALVRAATERTESRGAHARSDHPDTDPELHVRLLQ